jgi:hypothetical protein
VACTFLLRNPTVGWIRLNGCIRHP